MIYKYSELRSMKDGGVFVCIVYACCAWHQALRCIVRCAACFCVSAFSGVVAYYKPWYGSYIVPYVVVRCVLFVERSLSYWSTVY
jgi:hypothetical protein